MSDLLRAYVDVLDLFADDRAMVRMTQAEVARRLDIPRATAHRRVTDMVAVNWLVRDEDGRYRLGPFFLNVFEHQRMAEARTARRLAEQLKEDADGEEKSEGGDGGGTEQGISNGEHEGPDKYPPGAVH